MKKILILLLFSICVIFFPGCSEEELTGKLVVHFMGDIIPEEVYVYDIKTSWIPVVTIRPMGEHYNEVELSPGTYVVSTETGNFGVYATAVQVRKGKTVRATRNGGDGSAWTVVYE